MLCEALTVEVLALTQLICEWTNASHGRYEKQLQSCWCLGKDGRPPAGPADAETTKDMRTRLPVKALEFRERGLNLMRL